MKSLLALILLAPIAASQGVIMPPLPERRACAEFEPSLGTLVTFPTGLPASALRLMAKDDTLFILCDGPANELEATTALSNMGISMDSVEFIDAPTESIWTRDWGSPQIFSPGGQHWVVDPKFSGYSYDSFDGTNLTLFDNINHPNDDASPVGVANHINVGSLAFPADLVGGNIDFDGLGTAFCTQILVDENVARGVPTSKYTRLLRRVLGIDTLNVLPNYDTYGLQHIDCCMKVMDEETLMIIRPPVTHPASPYVEALAAKAATLTTIYGRPYVIHRIDTDVFDGTGPAGELANYANTLILNNKILVPTFDIPAVDTAALATYRAAMPGYEVSGHKLVGGPYPMKSYSSEDSLHCRSHQLFDPAMLMIKHPRVRTASASVATPVQALIRAYSGHNLISGETMVNWRVKGTQAWNETLLLPTGNAHEFAAQIPAQTAGTIVQYNVTAMDRTGKIENRPPTGAYSFTVN